MLASFFLGALRKEPRALSPEPPAASCVGGFTFNLGYIVAVPSATTKWGFGGYLSGGFKGCVWFRVEGLGFRVSQNRGTGGYIELLRVT